MHRHTLESVAPMSPRSSNRNATNLVRTLGRICGFIPIRCSFTDNNIGASIGTNTFLYSLRLLQNHDFFASYVMRFLLRSQSVSALQASLLGKACANRRIAFFHFEFNSPPHYDKHGLEQVCPLSEEIINKPSSANRDHNRWRRLRRTRYSIGPAYGLESHR